MSRWIASGGAGSTGGDVATKAMALRPTLSTPKPPAYTYLTTFQAGHGWSAGGAGSANLNDTSDYVLGTQAITITTDGANDDNGTIVSKAALMAATDLSAKQFAILVKVNDPNLLRSVSVQFGTGGFAAYANVNAVIGSAPGTKAPGQTIRPNEWTWVHFTWADLGNNVGAPNRAAITDVRIRAASRGLGAAVVKVAAIAHFPKATPYPNGVVSITLDDTYASHYTIARPALDKRGFGATLFPIVDQVGNAGRLTLAQMRQLVSINRWDVGGHAYSSTLHDSGYATAADAAVDADVSAVKQWLSDSGFGAVDHFAWPAGYDSLAADTIVRRYFTSARHTIRFPRPTLPPGNLMRVPTALFADASTGLGDLTAEVDNAYANGSWAMFGFHDIAASASGQTTATSVFTGLVDYCATKGIPVQPVGTVLRSLA